MSEKEASVDKIGILTFHCADNFGAMLQAYGLLSWLLGQGFDAFIVNYTPPRMRGREWFLPYTPERNPVKQIVHSLRGLYRNIQIGKVWWVRRRRMAEFRKEYLTRGGRAVYTQRSLSYVEADLLVVGSDQIWNPDITLGLQPAYFGAFANDRIRKIVAYGASLGSNRLPEEAEGDFSGLLAGVQEISMREKGATEYIETCFHRKAVHVVDPVFLPGPEVWRAIMAPVEENRFILYYELEYNEKLREAAWRLAKEKDLQVVDLSLVRSPGQWPFQKAHSSGPLQFLGYISAAEYVFTTSFHGAAFSILFHKLFLVDYCGVRKARIESLLDSTGLKDRMAGKGHIPAVREIVREINWRDVDDRLRVQREQSMAFLRGSLS